MPIALNFVDRYVAVHHAHGVLQDRAWYQRLSMTALYTALKLHGSAQHAMLDPSAICRLSMDTFSVAEIEAQELELVQTLQWRLNPPTAVQFVRQFVMLIPPQLLPQEEEGVPERVEEMALESITRRLRGGCEPHSIHLRPSQVAWNAVQESLLSCCLLGGRDHGKDETLEATIAHVLSCSGFDLGARQQQQQQQQLDAASSYGPSTGRKARKPSESSGPSGSPVFEASSLTPIGGDW